MKVRLLIASNESGSREEILFSTDFESPADDFFFGLTVSSDKVIDCDLPDTFPLDYNFMRKD